MSWQAYVIDDDHLMCRIDGSVWAQSPNFPQCKPEEAVAIMKDFCMVIQGEPDLVIQGKKGLPQEAREAVPTLIFVVA